MNVFHSESIAKLWRSKLQNCGAVNLARRFELLTTHT